MKLLTLTLRRPDGTLHTASERLSDAHAHDAAYVERERARIGSKHRDDRLEGWAIVDSTAVRKASERNTKVAEQHDLTQDDPDGRDFHAGVQHGDAVGQLEEAVVKPVNGDAETEGTRSLSELDTAEDTFAALEAEDAPADPGDTPPDSPDDADAPSTPSKRSKK